MNKVAIAASVTGVAALVVGAFIILTPSAPEPRAAAEAPQVELAAATTPFIEEYQVITDLNTNCYHYEGFNATNEEGDVYAGAVTIAAVTGETTLASVALTPTDTGWVGEVCVDLSSATGGTVALEVRGEPDEGFVTDTQYLTV